MVASTLSLLTFPTASTTACKWDTVIPFEPLWAEYKRLIKPRGAIVLFGSQPSTSALVMSNPKAFKYQWVWCKEKGANIAVLKYQPSKVHEDVLVFSFDTHNYYPIMEQRPEENKRNNKPRINKSGVQGDKVFLVEKSRGNNDTKYPTSVKFYSAVRGGLHPTQKPVALLEYLVRTYTNPGDTVLDNTMGSGTTMVACIQTGRRGVGIEKEAKYFEIARDRIEATIQWIKDGKPGKKPKKAKVIESDFVQPGMLDLEI